MKASNDDRSLDINRRAVPLVPDGSFFAVEKSASISARVAELGISAITTIAALPRNFETATSVDELVLEASAIDLEKIGRRVGIDVYSFREYGRTLHEHDGITIGLAIFVGLEAFNNASALVEFVKNLANYMLRGSAEEFNDEAEITQEFIVESGFTCKRLTYRGPASQIEKIVPVMRDALGIGERQPMSQQDLPPHE